jgi:acetylglutamate kinase
MSVVKFQTKKSGSSKLDSLMEVLPYIRLYNGETFVIHCDGEVLYNEELLEAFAQDIVLMRELGINIFIVHGGDRYVDEMLKRFNITSSYVDQMRVTDEKSIEIVEMVMSGLLNKKIVTKINDAGGMAIGLSGKDCNLIEAKKYRGSQSLPGSNIKNIIDLGYVGEPTSINPEILLTFEDTDIIPVISPIAIGENAETFCINAITVSGVIASSLSVCKYIVMSDCSGLRDKNDEFVTNMGLYQLKQLTKSKISSKEIAHIMHTGVCVLDNGVEAVHIIDGKVPHSLLLEVFTDGGLGTCIGNSESN